jgi:hypothetical protein
LIERRHSNPPESRKSIPNASLRLVAAVVLVALLSSAGSRWWHMRSGSICPSDELTCVMQNQSSDLGTRSSPVRPARYADGTWQQEAPAFRRGFAAMSSRDD